MEQSRRNGSRPSSALRERPRGEAEQPLRSPLRAAREIFHAAKERESFQSSRVGKGASASNGHSDGRSAPDPVRQTLSELQAAQARLEAEVALHKSRNSQLSDSLASTTALVSGFAEVIPQLQMDLKAVQKSLHKKNNGSVDRIPLVTDKAVDINAITEQVFQRVHKEFNSVVSDVVRTCISEQNHRIADTVQRYIDVIDARNKEVHDREVSARSRLEQRVEAMEGKIRSLQSAVNDRGLQFEQIQATAVRTYRGEVQSVLEAMTKKVNDCIASNNNFTAEKPAEIEKRVTTNVTMSLQSLCNKLELRSEGCENAIRSLLERSRSLDESLDDVRHKTAHTESLARHAFDLTSSQAGRDSFSHSRYEADCLFLRQNSPSSAQGDQRLGSPGQRGSPSRSNVNTMGEALNAVEKDNANALCRLNMLDGDIAELRDLTAAVKSDLNEKFNELKTCVESIEKSAEGFEGVQTLVKQNQSDIKGNTEKLALETTTIRSELSTCLRDHSDMKKDILVLKNELSSRPSASQVERMLKKLLMKALASESPVPSILVTSPSPTEDVVASEDIDKSASNVASPLFRPVPVAHSSRSASSEGAVHSEKSPSVDIVGATSVEGVKKGHGGPFPSDVNAIRVELVDVLQDIQKNMEDKCRSLISSELSQHKNLNQEPPHEVRPPDVDFVGASDLSVRSAPLSANSSVHDASTKASSSDLVGHVEEALKMKKMNVTDRDNGHTGHDAQGGNATERRPTGVSPEFLSAKKKEHRRKFQEDLLNGRAFKNGSC